MKLVVRFWALVVWRAVGVMVASRSIMAIVSLDILFLLSFMRLLEGTLFCTVFVVD